MHVRHLSLVDFRSYAAADLALAPGVTTLLGRNGQGKTNLVEALGYVASLSSHRVATDQPLVRFGAAQAVIRAVVVRHGRESLVELELTPGRANRVKLNRSALPRARDVLGTLRTVLFAPEDLALVKGDPAGRRAFLDDLLVARQPRWQGVRADYDRILKQRNALLKTAAPVLRRGARVPSGSVSRSRAGDADPRWTSGAAAGGQGPSGAAAGGQGAAGDARESALHTLDVWNTHLAQVGSQLLYARLRLVRDLTPYLTQAYDTVSATDSRARATYRASLREPVSAAIATGDVPDAETLRQELIAAFDEFRGQEVERGVTLAGPHRDDLVLALGDLPAKGYASHGEAWSFALALKLAAYRLLRHDLGEDPVLVLDDVFAELDVGRRLRLAEVIADCEQVLVTAAVEADVPELLRTAGITYAVTLGEVARADPA